MEELIFIALIFFFSIIESIARKRKKAGQAPQIPGEWAPPEEDDAEEWRARREPSRGSTVETQGYGGKTYDADPSFDDFEVEEAEAPRRSGSEGMIPAELWEEISGLAEAVKKKPELATPQPPPPALPTPPKAPARDSWGKRTPKVGQQHRIHLAHAEYGTDPSERARSAHDDLDPLARRLSADARQARKQLRLGRHALRQALILTEVLAPPISMRDSHRE